MLTNSGIYKITSPSGKCYIGSAVNFRSLTGKKKSAESIEKTASAHRGRKNSPEVREKMSRLARERAAKKRQDKLSLSLFDDRTPTVPE